MDKYVNILGGIILIILDEVFRNDEFRRGDLVLFVVVGVGWIWGFVFYKW